MLMARQDVRISLSTLHPLPGVLSSECLMSFFLASACSLLDLGASWEAKAAIKAAQLHTGECKIDSDPRS